MHNKHHLTKLHASFHPGRNLVYFVKINQQLLLHYWMKMLLLQRRVDYADYHVWPLAKEQFTFRRQMCTLHVTDPSDLSG